MTQERINELEKEVARLNEIINSLDVDKPDAVDALLKAFQIQRKEMESEMQRALDLASKPFLERGKLESLLEEEHIARLQVEAQLAHLTKENERLKEGINTFVDDYEHHGGDIGQLKKLLQETL